MADINITIALLQLIQQYGWHALALFVGVVLIAAVRSKRGISVQLGGGNGPSASQLPGDKPVTYQRFMEFREMVNRRLDEHDADTQAIRTELAGIRSKVQETAEAVARIEGKIGSK